MIFPFYLEGKLPFQQKINNPFLLTDLNQTKSKGQTTNITNNKKYSHPSDGLQWLKKKSPKNDQINRFNLQNSIRRKNFCQLPLAKFFLRRKSLLQTEQTEQNQCYKSREKRFHTESQFMDTKRKSIQLNKTFNKSFIDSQHNFTGKNYQKQVENLNINSSPLQQSKLKLFLQKKMKSSPKQKSNSFIFQKTYKPDEMSQNLFVKKRLSIKDRLEIRKSQTFIEQTPVNQQDQESINIKFRRQIQRSVKDDIKAQIIRLKKLKLNKLKFKDKHLKSGRKSLVIQQQPTKENQKNQQKSQLLPQHVQKFLTHYSCELKVKWNKGVQVIKKSHSSFNSYEAEDRETKDSSKKPIAPIYENLDPWQGQSAEFYGLC